MPMLSGADVEIYYELHGRGAPLLLIPGLASDSQSWMPVRDALAERFRLVLMDIRGAGRTAPMEAPISVPLLADDAVRLLDHLGIERCHVLGHSLGGLVAREFAERVPARTDRLVLVASGTIAPRVDVLLGDLAAAREAGLPMELWFRLLFQWLFRPGFLSDAGQVADAARLAAAYPYRQSHAAFRAQLRAGRAVDPVAGGPVLAPTLVLCGALDLLIAPAESAASFRHIARLECETLADAAHSLHWDQPGPFVEAVGRFLERA